MRDAALCSCSRASYPGDGVTVGGAALAGARQAEPHSASSAAVARLGENRFISFLPALTTCICAAPLLSRFGCDHCHFKASTRGLRFHGRICSGVSLGEPLPAASARLI